MSCKAVLAKANILNSSFKRLDVSKRKKIQLELSVDGYYKSSIDGFYGKGTAAALKAYNKEYLGNADLTKSDNISALFDDLLKEKPASLSADKCQYLQIISKSIGTSWRNMWHCYACEYLFQADDE